MKLARGRDAPKYLTAKHDASGLRKPAEHRSYCGFTVTVAEPLSSPTDAVTETT